MSFQLVRFGNIAQCGASCPQVISAEGEITNDTPREFYDFVAGNMKNSEMRSVVFLHSPGGGVVAAMRLGEMFRTSGVMAVVARIRPAPQGMGSAALAVPGARCLSACVYALMGAKKRVVPRGSILGIHRMFFYADGGDAASATGRPARTYGSPDFVRQLAKYASSMGVSRDVIFTAEKIDPDHIHVVTARELSRWRLASRK